MTTPAQIAASLTKAQREALAAFPEFYSMHVTQPLARELLALRLIDGPGRAVHPSQRGSPPEYILTETGLAVRDILKEMEG